MRLPPPSSANGAPLHFERIDLSPRHGKAQSLSVAVHVAIVSTLAFSLLSPPRHHDGDTLLLHAIKNPLSYFPPSDASSSSLKASLGLTGSGGEKDPRSTRPGNLAPFSSMPLVPPRFVHNENVALPAPPSVFDANAPANVAAVSDLGLPWMKIDTDSAGPGKHHGFGSGDGDSMGDGDTKGSGDGDSDSPYANVSSPVTCVYCPEPGYTEEARKAKLQGQVILRVLVGADGKAQRIKIVQGLGMGLDERAQEIIHKWQFSPARDAARRATSAWVTVETRFQLF